MKATITCLAIQIAIYIVYAVGVGSFYISENINVGYCYIGTALAFGFVTIVIFGTDSIEQKKRVSVMIKSESDEVIEPEKKVFEVLKLAAPYFEKKALFNGIHLEKIKPTHAYERYKIEDLDYSKCSRLYVEVNKEIDTPGLYRQKHEEEVRREGI